MIDAPLMNYETYDRIIVAFSGGKDSTACFLHLLEEGVDPERIELWHHLIDGEPGSVPFMDWPETEEYCNAFANHFNVPIYYSWRHGGFKREMLRENERTAPVSWQNPDGTIGTAGGKRGPMSTRRKFPQVSASLRTRWCSAALKIDVMSIAINNQERFNHSRTLVITGERGEESANRKNYLEFERHRSWSGGKKGRIVHHRRPILDWSEKMVWDIIERNAIVPHPAYYLGWGRLSCFTCIFGNADQWASAHALRPDMVAEIIKYEREFDTTIKRNKSVPTLIEEGTPYDFRQSAGYGRFNGKITTGVWLTPQGAYGDKTGPS